MNAQYGETTQPINNSCPCTSSDFQTDIEYDGNSSQVQTDVHGGCEVIKLTDHIPLFRTFAVHEPETSVINTVQRTVQGVVEMVRPSAANKPQIIGYNSNVSPATMTYCQKEILGNLVGLGEEACVLFTGKKISKHKLPLILRFIYT